MGRSPCCEKMGLKKGPWTPEEDRVLISYIQRYGHSNWRALPKEAGLLRCGKSCRLRWVNYLKPDIKRGNFTFEEEEALIKLHEMLGNRWSAIAARLPGRTDNEIKNVWHTHLKKRLNNGEEDKEKTKKKRNVMTKSEFSKNEEESSSCQAESPQQSGITTDVSSTMEDSSMQSLPEIDESFWAENLSIDDFEMASMIENVDQLERFGFEERVEDGDLGFWYNVFIQTGGSLELAEF